MTKAEHVVWTAFAIFASFSILGALALIVEAVL